MLNWAPGHAERGGGHNRVSSPACGSPEASVTRGARLGGTKGQRCSYPLPCVALALGRGLSSDKVIGSAAGSH